MKILTVENLSKSFGGIHANRDISFDVEEGSILGVIGPNGLISFIPKDILERKKQR